MLILNIATPIWWNVKSSGSAILSSPPIGGLCGGLNINLFKAIVTSMKEWRGQGAEIDLCVIGNKGIGFFKRHGGKLVSQASRLGDAPHPEELIGTVKVMLDAYQEGHIDRLFLARNEFVKHHDPAAHRCCS